VRSSQERYSSLFEGSQRNVQKGFVLSRTRFSDKEKIVLKKMRAKVAPYIGPCGVILILFFIIVGHIVIVAGVVFYLTLPLLKWLL
jgi:hypothetical protein